MRQIGRAARTIQQAIEIALLRCGVEYFGFRQPSFDVTMKLAWHFNKVNPCFKNREATQGEFFSNDTELRGFIREAVQNSLDAKRARVKSAVRVRIFVSGEKAALTAEKSKRYFQDGWNHFQSEGSGLRDVPRSDEPCRFITYEDSGTTGLTGDVNQYHEISGVRNPFYYFFRAEGQSNKTDGGRGRWGLGKFVFPRSSRIRSFFGVTVRHDDKQRLLVGQSILRSHRVDKKSYTPDGWFGQKPDKNEASLPVTDQRFIRKFLSDFRLKRDYDPGLSLVVPYCDERWTMSAVIENVILDYFYPILRNDLQVTVEDSDSKTIIDSQSLLLIAGQLRGSVQQALRPVLDLTVWALQQTGESLSTFSSGSSVDSCREVDTAEMDKLRRCFMEAGRVGVRIPVTIRRTTGVPQLTFFDAFIERAEGSAQKRPLFIRDGIVISDVKTRILRDVNAIVCASDATLTAFLGDAENPAHTEWSEESSHFKGKYLNGSATLRFIRNAVVELSQRLSETTEKDDPILLLDVFSLGTTRGQIGMPVSFPAMSSKAVENNLLRLKSLVGQKKKCKPFQLSSRKGGFRVGSRPRNTTVCAPIHISVAYDRRGGSPLRKYTTSDFQLEEAPVLIRANNATVHVIEPNHLIVYPQKEDFDVVVTGFDLNRDLFVQAKLIQETDRQPAARTTRRAA